MAVVTFTKNENTLTGGSDFFVAIPFWDAKSTDCKAKTPINAKSFFDASTATKKSIFDASTATKSIFDASTATGGGEGA